MRPDHEITDGIRLGVIAILSAVVTATAIIGAGQALLPKAETQAEPQTALVRASLPGG